jgi:hypothetical protein
MKEAIMSDLLLKEKSEKKEKSVEGWEKWCRGDLVDAVGWAAGFVWAAFVIIATHTVIASNIVWWDGWAVFFAGAGVIVLVETAVRLLLPAYRKGIAAKLIFGFILIGFGLGGLIGWVWVWPAVLVVVAATILKSALRSRAKA